MSMSNYVRVAYSDLPVGDSVRGECPSCGRSTFTVTRSDEGTLLWNCFRASCDLSGATAYGRSDLIRTKTPAGQPKPKLSPYLGSIRGLYPDEIQFLEGKVGFDDYHLDTSNVGWAEELDRYAFPVLGPMGQIRGWVMRSWDKDKQPKTLNYKEKDEPMTSFYPHLASGGLTEALIVEDIPSAVRASRYVSAVAMNSSGIGQDAANEIASWRRKVIWASDNDAVALGIKLARKYSMVFEESRPVYLPKDLKDMQEQELEEFISHAVQRPGEVEGVPKEVL